MKKHSADRAEAAPEQGLSTKKNVGGRPKRSIVAEKTGDLMTIHIQFPSADVAAIDRFATDKRQTRSAAVRSIVIDKLESAGYLTSSNKNPAPAHSDPAAAAFEAFWDQMTEAQRANWNHWAENHPVPPDEK